MIKVILTYTFSCFCPRLYLHNYERNYDIGTYILKKKATIFTKKKLKICNTI